MAARTASNHSVWRWLVAGVIGLLLVSALMFYLGQRKASIEFDRQSKLITQALAKELNTADVMLTTIAGLYQAGSSAQYGQFTAIAERLLKNYRFVDSIAALEWLKGHELRDFISDQRDLGFVDLFIKDIDGLPIDDLVPGMRNRDYLVLTRLEPLKPENARFLGIDMSSMSGLVQLSRDAAGSGSMVLTEAKDYPLAKSGSMVAMEAIYFGLHEPGNESTRVQQMRGLIVLTLDLGTALEEIPGIDLSRVGLTVSLETPGTSGKVYHYGVKADQEPFWTRILRDNSSIEIADTRFNILLHRTLTHQDFDKGGMIVAATIMILLLVSFFALWKERLISNRRLQTANMAFNHMAEGIIVTDSDRKIIAVNEAFTTVTGYKENEVLGKNPNLLSSGRHDKDFYASMWTSINEEGYWEGEIWNRRKSGELFPMWSTINVVSDQNGGATEYVAVFTDISEKLHNEESLRKLAYHDPLTGLVNRTAFSELFEHALSRAFRQESKLALLYIDLDHFKRINDTFGHALGDDLLVGVADRIKDVVRDVDKVARLGGDEFTILLEDLSGNEAPSLVANKILEAMRDPFVLGGERLFITASIGISIYPNDGDDANELLKNADAAMYLSKQEGRDKYRNFTESMARDANKRFEIESQLRHAIARDELFLVYQPQVSLNTGELIGVEALLRWNHPQKGILTPPVFLDVAKDAGLMNTISHIIIEDACRISMKWRKTFLRNGRVAVNVDLDFFSRDNIENYLIEVVSRSGATPDAIELEILEFAMMLGEEHGVPWKKLVKHGFKFAIDDFGIGESSLARLKSLPFTTLKIDRSFVRDIEKDEDDRAIINAIVAMGKQLGKYVIAEGVETKEQLHFLCEAGCDGAQGFYFAKPMRAEELELQIASLETEQFACSLVAGKV